MEKLPGEGKIRYRFTPRDSVRISDKGPGDFFETGDGQVGMVVETHLPHGRGIRKGIIPLSKQEALFIQRTGNKSNTRSD